MGDVGETYRALDEIKKERKKERLAAANPEGWTQHTPYHWSRVIDGKKLNYWPSTGKVRIGNKNHNINSKKIKALLAKEGEE